MGEDISFVCEYCGGFGEHVCLPELVSALEDEVLAQELWAAYLALTDQHERIGGEPPVFKRKRSSRSVAFLEDMF